MNSASREHKPMINTDYIEIEGLHNWLAISDEEDSQAGGSRPVLYIPDGRRAGQTPIVLTVEGAKALHDWLARWLADERAL